MTTATNPQRTANTQTFSIKGHVTAVTHLTVTRPDDNFRSPGQSEKLSRLPRAGAKTADTPVYFPASSLNGALRRAGEEVIRRANILANGEDAQFSCDETYMIIQGVDTTKELMAESKTSGLVEEELALRKTNPFLSLFGRWGVAGHWGIHDLMIAPEFAEKAVVYVNGNGARTNIWARTPEKILNLSAEDRKRVSRILIDDQLKAKDIVASKDEIALLKKQLRAAATAEEKTSIQEQIGQLETDIDTAKSAKEGATESIQRPLEGYECIAPGTVFSHSMVASNVTPIEMGLLIETLAEFSRDPRVGGHSRQGAGEIEAVWDVSLRPVGSWKSITIGRIKMSREEFAIEDLTDDKFLSTAVEEFNNAMANMKDSGIDFKQFKKVL